MKGFRVFPKSNAHAKHKDLPREEARQFSTVVTPLSPPFDGPVMRFDLGDRQLVVSREDGKKIEALRGDKTEITLSYIDETHIRISIGSHGEEDPLMAALKDEQMMSLINDLRDVLLSEPDVTRQQLAVELFLAAHCVRMDTADNAVKLVELMSARVAKVVTRTFPHRHKFWDLE